MWRSVLRLSGALRVNLERSLALARVYRSLGNTGAVSVELTPTAGLLSLRPDRGLQRRSAKMPSGADKTKPPLHDQITEMQRKIQLLGKCVWKKVVWGSASVHAACFATVTMRADTAGHGEIDQKLQRYDLCTIREGTSRLSPCVVAVTAKCVHQRATDLHIMRALSPPSRGTESPSASWGRTTRSCTGNWQKPMLWVPTKLPQLSCSFVCPHLSHSQMDHIWFSSPGWWKCHQSGLSQQRLGEGCLPQHDGQGERKEHRYCVPFTLTFPSISSAIVVTMKFEVDKTP